MGYDYPPSQPLHLTQPCRNLGFVEGQFPVAKQASHELLALPLYPELTGTLMEEILLALENVIKA